jgi:hypothetical protein
VGSVRREVAPLLSPLLYTPPRPSQSRPRPPGHNLPCRGLTYRFSLNARRRSPKIPGSWHCSSRSSSLPSKIKVQPTIKANLCSVAAFLDLVVVPRTQVQDIRRAYTRLCAHARAARPRTPVSLHLPASSHLQGDCRSLSLSHSLTRARTLTHTRIHHHILSLPTYLPT